METLTKKEVLDKKKIFDFLHLESSSEADGQGRDGDGRDGNGNGMSKEEMMRNVKNFVWIKKKKSKSSRTSYTIKTHIYSKMDSDKPIYLHVSPVGDLQIIQFRDLMTSPSDIAQENHYHVIATFYESYQFTQSLKELLLIPVDHIRIYLDIHNITSSLSANGGRFDLNINVFLSHIYLLDLKINQEYLLLFRDMIKNQVNKKRKRPEENSDGRVQQWKRDLPEHHYPSYRYSYDEAPEITVASKTITDIEEIEIGGICNEKRVLFPHQIENIEWMTRHEEVLYVELVP